jgi:hypothetical protein
MKVWTKWCRWVNFRPEVTRRVKEDTVCGLAAN